MERILIVGGAGFIGSNFVRMMAARYPVYKLTVFDNLAYAGTLAPIQDLVDSGRAKFIRADVCTRHAIQSAIAESDAVVNFAAHSHVDRSIDDATPFMLTNA